MKVFQLKATRAVLELSVRDIGGYIGVSGTAVSTWESKGIHLNVNTSEQNIKMLEQFFAIKNVFFTNEDSVLLNESNAECKNDGSQILTRFQLKGGRAILGINRKDIKLSDSGFRMFKNQKYELFMDMGGVKAS
jgi:transcriptional regulator with XRE-family HTH domain